MTLTDAIIRYYDKRGLQWPKDAWEALGWLHTELGEVYELLQARRGGWVRNNPENKEPFSLDRLEDELAHCLMMVIVTGNVEGVNPEDRLLTEMKAYENR